MNKYGGLTTIEYEDMVIEFGKLYIKHAFSIKDFHRNLKKQKTLPKNSRAFQ